MAVPLADIISAINGYQAKILVKVTNVGPTAGGVIDPGEKFNFTLEATNATQANGGYPITDVCFRITISNDSSALLVVPPTNVGIATTGPSRTSENIPPGQEIASYFLHKKTWMDPGEKIAVDLQGAAKAAGANKVYCSVSFRLTALSLRSTANVDGAVAIG